MTYTVQTGDSLSAIAQSHGCTLEALLEANPRCRADPNRLAIGDVLILPGDTTPAAVDGQGVDGAAAGTPAAAPGAAGAGAGVPPISERAIAMIIGFEVTSRDVYVRDVQRPTWPGLESGVTIGIGYDVGQSSVADLRASWEGQLQPAIVDRLSTACRVTGNAAKALTAQLQDIVVRWEAAEFVFRHRDIPAYTRRTCDALSNTELLSPDSLGALVSLVFNRGASFSESGARYTEMRAIRDAMQRRSLQDIPALIRGMKHLWVGVPGAQGLLTRRDDEADLFAAGLTVATTPTAQPAA